MLNGKKYVKSITLNKKGDEMTRPKIILMLVVAVIVIDVLQKIKG